MSGLLNKVKEAVVGQTGTQDSAATHHQGDNGKDAHQIGLNPSWLMGNLDYDTSRTGHGSDTTGYGSTDTSTRGPHSSNLENKLDPRVDGGKLGSSQSISHNAYP